MPRTKNQKQTSLTPSSANFSQYIDTEITPFLYDSCNRNIANQLIVLIQYLERKRYDFSADRAFQTRPICISEIAEHFLVTVRSVQRWLSKLESFGILHRQFRKDPQHRCQSQSKKGPDRGVKLVH
jgi:DNA-binding transcriptional ArsR family regulator